MSEFDPTTNRIPFGLLSESEKTLLIHWPHGFEYFHDGKWIDCTRYWSRYAIYRGKSAPVVTSVWLNVYPANASLPYKSRSLSDSTPCSDLRIAVLRIDTCNGVSTAHLEEI